MRTTQRLARLRAHRAIPGGGRVTIPGLLTLLLAGPLAADDDVFELRELAVADRVVAAEAADYDGDGHVDLMTSTIAGIPPGEVRQASIWFQGTDGAFGKVPDVVFDLPPESAVYDAADVLDAAGVELLFLRPDRVTIAAIGRDGVRFEDRVVERPDTVAAASDERGLDAYPLVYDEFADEPWILVPQIGAYTILTASGDTIDRIDTDRRANYFVSKPTGLVSFESDVQLFLDLPKLSVGDVDGDGLADIVTATRHEIRTFLREPDGGFRRSEAYSMPLEFISVRDHLRGSGALATSARDIDADGRLDLLVSHVEGTLTDTVTRTYVFRNDGERWHIDDPDEQFAVDKVLSSDLLLNIDQDPELELLRVQLKFTVLELIELLLQRRLDAVVAIHQYEPGKGFGKKPWSTRKMSTGISFDTFRPKGFMPRGQVDLNADGYMDFVTSANGDGIEVWLGGEEKPFRRRAARQELPTAGSIRFADLDGNDLPDFVLYDAQNPGSPVRIGLNNGILPGTPEPPPANASTGL